MLLRYINGIPFKTWCEAPGITIFSAKCKWDAMQNQARSTEHPGVFCTQYKRIHNKTYTIGHETPGIGEGEFVHKMYRDSHIIRLEPPANCLGCFDAICKGDPIQNPARSACDCMVCCENYTGDPKILSYLNRIWREAPGIRC